MSDQLHELIAALKDFALELGRSPTRAEFETRIKNGNLRIKKAGGFITLLKAAGLETYDERRSGKRITNAIFERDLSAVLEAHKPREESEREKWPRIAIISDIHWPFSNAKVLEAFHAYCKQHKPEIVIINGDAWDMYAHSKYPRSYNTYSPRDEQELSRKANEAFWKRIQTDCPGVRCIQMLGNHDVRPLKRVLESYPAAEDWVEEMLRRLFTYEGVETIFDPRQELMLPGNIMVHHGYRSKLGDHSSYTLYNCIVGHTHLGGVVFRQMRGQVRWECNSGVAGDPESKALSYSPQKITHWTPGFAWVDEYGPRFIPV